MPLFFPKYVHIQKNPLRKESTMAILEIIYRVVCIVNGIWSFTEKVAHSIKRSTKTNDPPDTQKCTGESSSQKQQ